jgi:hydroxyethylthiazole kinase-like uncharacterized protein yjeF
MPEPIKILTAQQIKAADEYTMQHEPVTAIDLMERAAKACTAWIEQHISSDKVIKVFCGMGNNGGDGLAIARLLSRAGYAVEVYIIKHSNTPSQGFSTNLKRLLAENVVEITDAAQLPVIAPADIVIDALFGTGTNREVSGIAAVCIQHINKSTATVCAVDVPSGLLADMHTNPDSAVVHATHTLTFQFPKRAFLFTENGERVGIWHILDIGLSEKYTQQVATPAYYLTMPYISSLLQSKPKFAHKGTFGHSLIVAGSYGKIGAAVLAAKACLRSGTGLLSIRTPTCGYAIIQVAVPEAMADMDSGTLHLQDNIVAGQYSSIGIGPGIGTDTATQAVLHHLLQHSTAPLVLDADALNMLAADKTKLSLLPHNSILTPHPKEFERLTHAVSNDFERHGLQREFSAEHKVYVVLKGAHTCSTTPEGQAYFNSTGNPGMARGGSGDVLTGVLTGLLAQGYNPLHACLLGVYIHGLAGDIAAMHMSTTAMTSADIIEHLPQAFIKMN